MLTLMSMMVLISSFLIIKIIPVRIIVLTAGLIGGIVVRFFVPTARKEQTPFSKKSYGDQDREEVKKYRF